MTPILEEWTGAYSGWIFFSIVYLSCVELRMYRLIHMAVRIIGINELEPTGISGIRTYLPGATIQVNKSQHIYVAS